MMSPMSSSKTRVPRMLRGSLVTLRRRCGKPSCHCATGQQPHEALALSYSDSGRTRVVMLAETDVAAVTAALERYRAAKVEQRGEPGHRMGVRPGATHHHQHDHPRRPGRAPSRTKRW